MSQFYHELSYCYANGLQLLHSFFNGKQGVGHLVATRLMVVQKSL